MRIENGTVPAIDFEQIKADFDLDDEELAYLESYWD